MMLSVNKVRKAHAGRAVLTGVDLSAEEGELLGLLGLNGAGKTTLVSIIACLYRPDAGEVTVGGVDALRHPRRVRRHLGLAPQDLGVYPTISVRENLVFFAELGGLRGRALRARTAAVVESLDLEAVVDRCARTLSGGEKRRLHTAIALLHQPRLLLLDEPTVGVDTVTRRHLLSVVRELADDGVTICYSTHYLHELEDLGATIAILNQGRIVVCGPLDEVVAAHGVSAVDLTFYGEVPPSLLEPSGALANGRTVRIPSSNPAKTAAEALAGLEGATADLESVEFIRPSLESAFMTVVGQLPTTDGETS